MPKVIHLTAPRFVNLIERPELPPKDLEATVKIFAAGICANDLAIIRGQSSIGSYPITPGHESIGVIENVGANVTAFSPGDWVTIYPSIGCGHCQACLDGRINHCLALGVMGINQVGGCFAEKINVPSQQLMKVPKELQNESGALIEPTAVAVHVNRRANTKPGARVAIIGAGVIGILTALVARALGASEIVLVDQFEEREQLCLEMGLKGFVHGIHNLKADPTPRFDIVFDMVCEEQTIDAALEVLIPGAKLLLVATPKDKSLLVASAPKIYRRELSLIAARNYVRQDFYDAIELLAKKAVVADPIITGRFALSDFQAAINALETQPEKHVKILVLP